MHGTVTRIRGLLTEGNRRALRKKIAEPREHAPKYAVLACADARVDPAQIFDAEPGSLFVVRTAGNVAMEHVLESLRFAAGLGIEAVVVLSHTDCGAIKDALGESPLLPATAHLIRENLKEAKDPTAAARAHARATADRLEKALRVPAIAALYHTESGEVEWL